MIRLSAYLSEARCFFKNLFVNLCQSAILRSTHPLSINAYTADPGGREHDPVEYMVGPYISLREPIV